MDTLADREVVWPNVIQHPLGVAIVDSSAYYEIGRFVVSFQRIEAEVAEIIGLLAQTDEEVTRILINELDCSEMVKTADVLFARFLDVRRDDHAEEKRRFHKLSSDLLKLGERRNEIVHSKYTAWKNVEGKEGLLRKNSRLRGSKGFREESEEEILPESIAQDIKRLVAAVQSLDAIRLKIIDWIYPND